MKRIIITILYWALAVLLVSAVLGSLKYDFREALLLSIMLVPGCIVLKFALPKVSFLNLRKGIADVCFISAAVIVGELLFMLCSHIAIKGFPAMVEGIRIPPLLINPAFLVLIMAFFTGSDYLLTRYLKKAFAGERKTISFTSDYKKVSLDLSEIRYVESRDTEVWVYATEDRRFRNKTGINQWENLLGDDFIRVHRSYVVNRAVISEASHDSLTLSGGTSIPVSRKYRESVATLCRD